MGTYMQRLRELFLPQLQSSIEFKMERPISRTSNPPSLESLLPEDTKIDYDVFEANFEQGEELGSGANGIVIVWTRKASSLELKHIPDKVAVKTITVKLLNRKYIKREIETLSKLEHHPNILTFYGYFVCSVTKPSRMEYIGIITELCPGTLYDLMLYDDDHYWGRRRKLKHYEVARIFKQVLKGIQFLHNNSVIHRDIKPSNILLVCSDNNIDWKYINTSKLIVKLGDFGLSDTYEEEDSMSFSGTFAFIAPEVRQACGQDKRIPADNSVDIWAAGLVAVMLLNAEFPPVIFTEDDILQMTRKSEENDNYEENDNFLPFLLEQIQVEPNKRSSANKLLEHSYLNEYALQEKDILCAIMTNDTVYLKKLLSTYNVNKVQLRDNQFVRPRHPLYCAAYYGSLDCAKLMVEQFVAQIDSSGAMCLAAANGNKIIVEYLINQGGKVNVTNEKDQTPLMLASEKNHIDIVRLLASDLVMADVGMKDWFDRTAIHHASQRGNLESVKHLIQYKTSVINLEADVATVGDPWSDRAIWGMTELHYACEGGHKDVVKFLICDAKADHTKTAKSIDGNELNPLHFASVSGNWECLDLLLTTVSMDVNARTKEGRTPFLLACMQGNLEEVKYLAEKTKADLRNHVTDNKGRNPLHYAMMSYISFIDVVKYLVESCHIDATAIDNKGRNALHHEVRSNMIDIDVIKYLVDTCHVDASAADNKGKNALHHAVISNANMFFDIKVLKYLIEACNIDPKVTDDRDRNALHYAVLARTMKIELIQYLVEDCHMDVTCTDKDSRNALHYAAMNHDEMGTTFRVVKYLVETYKIDVTSTDNEGKNALHHAAIRMQCKEEYTYVYSYIDMIKYLVEKCNIDPNKTDNEGKTALHYAVMFEDTVATKTVKYFVEKCHVDATATDHNNRNALHYAAESGRVNIDVIKYLVDICHIDAKVTDNKGRNALHYVTRSQRGGLRLLEAVKYLIETCCIDASVTDHEGRNALHHVAMTIGANFDVLKYLVETCGVDAAATDNKGLKAEELVEDKLEDPRWRKYCQQKINYLTSKRQAAEE